MYIKDGYTCATCVIVLRCVYVDGIGVYAYVCVIEFSMCA